MTQSLGTTELSHIHADIQNTFKSFYIVFTVIYLLFICIDNYNPVPGFVILPVLTYEWMGHLVLGAEPCISTRYMPAFSRTEDSLSSAEEKLEPNPERRGKYQKQ